MWIDKEIRTNNKSFFSYFLHMKKSVKIKMLVPDIVANHLLFTN